MIRFWKLSVAFLFIVAGNASADSGGSESPVLRVGVIQSLSGIAAEDGSTVVQALELAAQEINNTEKIKVELLVEDDATDPRKSVSAYQKLRELNVHAIIGPTWSFTVNSVLPLAARDKLVLINSSTLPECLELGKSSGFGFSTAVKVTEHARVFGEYLKKYPAKSVVLFFTSNSWGHAQRDAYKKVLSEQKVVLADEIESTNFDLNDWMALLPRVKALNSDLWLLLLNKADVDTIIRRASEFHGSARLFASYHLADLLRNKKDLQLFDNVCFPYPGEQLQSETEFAGKFREKYHEAPKVFADNSYDTLFLLHRAFAMSQSNGLSLQDSLHAIKLRGVVGEYQFRESESFSIGKASLMCGSKLLKSEAAGVTL